MDDLNPEEPPLASAQVRVEASGDCVVAISGELDLATVPEVERHVTAELPEAPRGIVVDLSKLTFADTSGIALWVRWSLQYSSFALANVPDLVRRTIGEMGLNDRLGIS